MDADVSKNVFELFSGRKRTRVGPTVMIAVLVTSLVAVPFLVRAIDGRDEPAAALPLAPARPGIVLVDTAATDPAPLDLATVAGSLLISLNEPDAKSASFRLYSAGSSEPLLASQDLSGPQFDLIVSESGGGTPLDSRLLRNGKYELFVTLSTGQEQRRTAVSFTVRNQ